MENILLNSAVVLFFNAANKDVADLIVDERITSGSTSDIIDPATGDVVVFQDYLKKSDFENEDILSESDFNEIFENS